MTKLSSATEKERERLYNRYYDTMTREDAKLCRLITQLESLFIDMCWEPHSIVSDFIDSDLELHDVEPVEFYEDYALGLFSFKWRFYVKDYPNEDVIGLTKARERTIEINRTHKDNIPVILHEMIHAHEIILEGLPSFYRDDVMLSLYIDLSKKIPDLYERIIHHANEPAALALALSNGVHDVLFFLKSLDLDLKFGYPLGTVCGYGRDKFNKEVS